MLYQIGVFASQMGVLDEFIQHLCCYRAIQKRLASRGKGGFIWSLSANAHLLTAANLWCMVFGSHGTNPTHWKHLVMQSDRDDLVKSFRAEIFARLNMQHAEWQAYQANLCFFRDNYAAHRALSYDRPVPNFDRARDVAFLFDEWVRKIIAPDTISGPLLRESVEALEEGLAREIVWGDDK